MLKKLSLYLDSNGRNNSYREENEYRSKGQNPPNKTNFDFIHLIQSWKEIAGDKLSEHTIPLKNQNGTLIVLSNHSAFASEMKFMEGPLKKKIFEKYPALESQIKTIHFIVDSTHFEKQLKSFSPEFKTNAKKAFVPHPYSPEYKKAVKEAQEMFANITDLEMQNTFVSIYVQNKFKDFK